VCIHDKPLRLWNCESQGKKFGLHTFGIQHVI